MRFFWRLLSWLRRWRDEDEYVSFASIDRLERMHRHETDQELLRRMGRGDGLR